MKKIAYGREFFPDFGKNDCYYVDKTPLIKEVFKNDRSSVLLLARPRYFGKTLTLSTFCEFLRINPQNPDNPEDVSYQERLFKDAKIFEDKDFCREYMGKFPVIYAPFNHAYGAKFENAYASLGSSVYRFASEFRYLLKNENGRLSEDQLARLAKLFDRSFLYKKDSKKHVIDSLNTLCELLHAYHGVKPILLIDEYDVPLFKSQALGFYDDMAGVMLPLYESALKRNPHLGKAVITGCLSYALDGMGLSNFKACSILDADSPEISKGLGFTEEETRQIIGYYGLEGYYDAAETDYGGYRFGRERLFNPMHIIHFCDEHRWVADEYRYFETEANYWINSLIEEYMAYFTPEHIDRLQTLIGGGTVTLAIRTTLGYDDLKNRNFDDFWTLLVYTGYLGADPESLRFGEPSAGYCVGKLRITNRQVNWFFRDSIRAFYRRNQSILDGKKDFAKGLLAGDARCVERNLSYLLSKYIPLDNLAADAPEENYCYGFMKWVLKVIYSKINELDCSQDTGCFCVDLLIYPYTTHSVEIIEIKQINDETQDIGQIAKQCLEQIKSKKHAEIWLDRLDIKSIYIYGICFCKKECSVAAEKLK